MRMSVLVAFGNDDAAVYDIADDVFELDGRMDDAEALRERALHLSHDRFRFGWGNIRDRDMARQRVAFRSYAPDVQVMHVVHAANLSQSQLDLLQFHTPRRSLKQNIQALADDAERRPDDHHADENGKHRVDVIATGERNSNAAKDNRECS